MRNDKFYKLFEGFRSSLKEDDIDEITAAKKRGIVLPDTIEELKKYLSKDAGSPQHYMHFSDLNKLGINPSSTYNTPIGIYGYPVTSQLIADLESGDIPFASGRRYIHVFSAKVPGKVLTIDRVGDPLTDSEYEALITKIQRDPSFEKLEKHSATLKTFRNNNPTFPEESALQYRLFVKLTGERYREAISNLPAGTQAKLKEVLAKSVFPRLIMAARTYPDNPVRVANVYFKSSTARDGALQKLLPPELKEEKLIEEAVEIIFSARVTPDPGNPLENKIIKHAEKDAYDRSSKMGKFWNVTRVLAFGNAKIWAAILDKTGFHGIDDEGTGTIHPNEPAQVVFFRKEYINHDEAIINKSRPEDVSRKTTAKFSKNVYKPGSVFSFTDDIEGRLKINLLNYGEINWSDLEEAFIGIEYSIPGYVLTGISALLGIKSKVEKLDVDDIMKRRFKIIDVMKMGSTKMHIFTNEKANDIFGVKQEDLKTLISILEKVGDEPVTKEEEALVLGELLL